MTQDELNEYNQLSPTLKEQYNWGMRQHPEWTHQQAMTYVYIVGVTIKKPDIISTTGTNNPNELKEIYKRIVVKAQEFIKIDFPRIYQQVKDYFVQAINWLENAVNVTIDRIINFFK